MIRFASKYRLPVFTLVFTLLLGLTGCDVGSGNGVQRIEIVPTLTKITGTTADPVETPSVQVRSGQCYGEQLFANAIFNDGTSTPISLFGTGLNWAVTGGNATLASINDLPQVESTTTIPASILLPQSSGSGEIKATYLGALTDTTALEVIDSTLTEIRLVTNKTALILARDADNNFAADSAVYSALAFFSGDSTNQDQFVIDISGSGVWSSSATNVADFIGNVLTTQETAFDAPATERIPTITFTPNFCDLSASNTPALPTTTLAVAEPASLTLNIDSPRCVEANNSDFGACLKDNDNYLIPTSIGNVTLQAELTLNNPAASQTLTLNSTSPSLSSSNTTDTSAAISGNRINFNSEKGTLTVTTGINDVDTANQGSIKLVTDDTGNSNFPTITGITLIHYDTEGNASVVTDGASLASEKILESTTQQFRLFATLSNNSTLDVTNEATWTLTAPIETQIAVLSGAILSFVDDASELGANDLEGQVTLNVAISTFNRTIDITAANNTTDTNTLIFTNETTDGLEKTIQFSVGIRNITENTDGDDEQALTNVTQNTSWQVNDTSIATISNNTNTRGLLTFADKTDDPASVIVTAHYDHDNDINTPPSVCTATINKPVSNPSTQTAASNNVTCVAGAASTN